MKRIIFLVLVLSVFTLSKSFSQYSNNLLPGTDKKLSLKTLAVGPVNTYLGVAGGIAMFSNNTGLDVGFFAEIKMLNFSIVPQANYWKVNDETNFELAALMRYRLKNPALEPYFDGGIGVNFYNNNSTDSSVKGAFTQLSLDIGGGVEFLNVGTNYSLFVDGKYKIIIRDGGNIKGVVISGGINFFL